MTANEDTFVLVSTEDGSLTLHSNRYDEQYHSKLGAHAEAQELYMRTSGFLDRLATGEVEPLAVLDIGLGLGYNALSTIEAWLTAPHVGDLELLSLEHDPLLVEALAQRTGTWLCSFSESWLNILAALEKHSSEEYSARLTHPKSEGASLHWKIMVGAAESCDLSQCAHRFDYVWQDAFSPKKNPELWSADWFAKLLASAAEDAVLVSYSVARLVRDHLDEAGWVAEKVPGPGVKRHWLRARPAVVSRGTQANTSESAD